MAGLTPRVALLMTLPPLMWAGNAVVGRLAVGSVPPLTLNLLRWALALLLLLPLGWRVFRAPRELAARWPHLLLLGTLGVGSYNALQYLALQTSTPINVTLIAASMPVWMLAIGALCHGVRPQRRQLAGAALSLAGVALVIARGNPAALARVQFVTGDLYILVAIIAWAFYSWMLARPPEHLRGARQPLLRAEGQAPRPWNWSEALLVQVAFGLVSAAAAAAGEQALGSAPIRWNAWVVAALLFVAIGPSLIAYRCWGLGVALAGPAAAAFFGNLTPLFAALLSAALLGELPQWYHGVAFALIVAGIGVSTRRSTPGRRDGP
ncbi:EamA family transporter [Methylibium sp. Pch-M]|uniref:DMT family transporter n=1 Tax=Methylibium sp. Pch-M TaxID=2082386 RepID=UPI001010F781|nr:DMT family transporter [Methylibium sp. Pch-M]QAZ38814.1 EamA family transporter [Methylibium sp. Pch-M]